jgi:hypothetical protein
MQRKLLRVISLNFDITGPLLIKYSAFVKRLEKKWENMRQCIGYLWTSRKPIIHLEER